jgi:hypothetical protein
MLKISVSENFLVESVVFYKIISASSYHKVFLMFIAPPTLIAFHKNTCFAVKMLTQIGHV